jgi:short-subunit dehydrogenase
MDDLAMNGHTLDAYQRLQAYGPAAVVTGASSGIGEAFATLLARGGFDLLICARRGDRLEQLAARLRDHQGVNVTVCVADLASSAGVGQLAASCSELDIGLVVSNAGFGMKGAYTDHDVARMDDMLQLNCRAPMQLAHQLIPRLLKRERAGMIFTSSVEALMGFPYSVPYAASKAFVNSLCEGLWGEYSAQGIDILGLCPGSTDTEAHALQGIDQSKLEGMMSAETVAQLALENICNGPIYIAGEQNRESFESVTAMPRRDALLIMGESMKASLL